MLPHQIYSKQVKDMDFVSLYLKNRLYYPCNFNNAQTASSYLIFTVSSINDITCDFQKAPSIRLRATLFHSQYSAFLGRTYTTPPLQIISKSQSTAQSFREMFVITVSTTEYYKLILEVSLFYTDKNGIAEEEESIGYAAIDLSMLKGKNKTYLTEGTPRELAFESPFATKQNKTSISYDIITSTQSLQSIMRLLPTNAIIGINDIVPGFIPSQLPGSIEKLQSLSNTPVVISGIVVVFPNNIIPLILKSVKTEQTSIKRCEVTEQSITSMELHIDCNNTWKNVISPLSISLHQSSNAYTATGKLVISDMIVGKHIALILSLHCTTSMKIGSVQVSKTYTIAYDIIHPLTLYDNVQNFQLELKVFPQINYFGPKLLMLDDDVGKIVLSLDICKSQLQSTEDIEMHDNIQTKIKEIETVKYDYAHLLQAEKTKMGEAIREIEENVKTMYKTTTNDKKHIEPKAATTNKQANTSMRVINTADFETLFKNGVTEDEIKQESNVFETNNLKLEESDPYKASIIKFKFIALKPPPNFNTKAFYLPKAIYFTMDFFVFQGNSTAPSMLQNNGQEITNHPIPLKSKDQGSLTEFTFQIDPNILYSDASKDLIHYLFTSNAQINIWDADSGILFGTTLINLNCLMRQGKADKSVAREADIMQFGVIVASLHVVLSNKGIRTADLQPTQTIFYGTINKAVKAKKKKVISKPIDDAALATYMKKKSHMGEKDIVLNDIEKESLMNEYKAYQKDALIKNTRVLEENQANQKLQIKIGQPSYYLKEITNRSDSRELYNISISDPCKISSLVTDMKEVSEIIEQRGLKLSNPTNLINGNALMLDPREEYVVVVKFMCLNQIVDKLFVRLQISKKGIPYEECHIQPVTEPLYINQSYLYLKAENKQTLITTELPFEQK